MIGLIALFLILVAVSIYINFKEEQMAFGIAFFCMTFLIALMTIGSPFMLNMIMKFYEKGEVIKEYTVVGTDTTYRYIYTINKKKNHKSNTESSNTIAIFNQDDSSFLETNYDDIEEY